MSRYLVCLLTAAGVIFAAQNPSAEAAHAIAMHGEAKYAAGFAHFPYVNPEAPKGGRVTLGRLGSFDSTNPLIVKGEPSEGIREFVIESLMTRGLDEPFTLYGLLAESVEVAPDRSTITFNINPLARFSDGNPVTADDVLFSLDLLRRKGRPNHRTYYSKVEKAERLSDLSVRLTFAPSELAQSAASGPAFDREMPLIMGLMPVLPKHRVDPEAFDRSTLEAPIGSGPYTVGGIDPGRSITFKRNPDYWGRDLPVNRGRYNFEEVRYDYYRENSAMFEAFKLGNIDLRGEDDPARWAQAYKIPAVDEGRIVRAEIATGLPAGMNALTFNTRREVFRDPKVRQAVILLFNFEWANQTLFNNLYKRTQSFFERSELAALGAKPVRPADERERALLAPFPESVKPSVLDGTYRFPVGDPNGHNRDHARKAYALLTEAGFVLQDGILRNKHDGSELKFEILAANTVQERLLTGFVSDMKRMGITANVRVVDSAQYQSRLTAYDFDMIATSWASSLSPGNEQLFRWSSKAAETPGTFNYPGVKSPAADALISAMLSAETREDFTSAVRALDRVLISGDYVIPLFYGPKQWIAHWRRLKHPEAQPLFGFNLESWWIEEEKGP
jgi:peptide/nickel transport system substrate-binding protein